MTEQLGRSGRQNHMPPGIGNRPSPGSRSVGTHRRFLYGAPSPFKTPPVTPVKNRNTPMCRCSFALDVHCRNSVHVVCIQFQKSNTSALARIYSACADLELRSRPLEMPPDNHLHPVSRLFRDLRKHWIVQVRTLAKRTERFRKIPCARRQNRYSSTRAKRGLLHLVDRRD